MALTRSGKCLCGAVKYQVSGQPIRVGLCHCLDCQKESGSAFATFGIWPASAFASSGKVTTFQGRCFCPACGARVFTESDGDEAEIRVGSLEEASGLIPGYELWVKRRQPWLLALPWADQFDEDRPAGNSDGPKTRNG
ncbi:MAG: GFA family protein [Mesorhizobium sp.]|jgi:hypothetical protein